MTTGIRSTLTRARPTQAHVGENLLEPSKKESLLLAEPRYRVVIDLGVCSSEKAASKLVENLIGHQLRFVDDDLDRWPLASRTTVLERKHFTIQRA